ncbi:AMIN domain-containing protein [bacterium]|nr:AMIN domain-containing protein [bacterium]
MENYRASANTMDSLPGVPCPANAGCRVSPSMKQVNTADLRWSTELIVPQIGATSCRIWGRANLSRRKYRLVTRWALMVWVILFLFCPFSSGLAADAVDESEGTIAVGIEENTAAEQAEEVRSDSAETEADTDEDAQDAEEAMDWAARLTRISVETINGLPQVTIVTTNKTQSAMTYLSNPDRLLLKVRNTLLTWKPNRLTVNQSPLNRIRSAQHDADVWVVFDLEESVKWVRETYSSGITLKLPRRYASRYDREPDTTQAAKNASRQERPSSRKMMPAGASYHVVDVAVSDIGEKTRLTITTDGQAKYRVKRERQGRIVSLQIYGAALTWQGSPSGLPAGVIKKVRARQKKEDNQPVVDIRTTLHSTSPYLVFKDQNQVLIEFDNPGTLQPGRKRGNLNSRISVDLQNADLSALLRALAQDAGFDLIVTPGLEMLEGTQSQVTLSINEQPLKNVLDFILRPRQMAYGVDGNTLRVGLAKEFPVETRVFSLKNIEVKNSNIKTSLEGVFTDGSRSQVVLEPAENRVVVSAIPSDMSRIKDVIADMDRQSRLVTRSFSLSYTQVEKVAPLIKSILSSLGSLESNSNENALVVNDLPGNINKIARMLRSLDTKAQQVMIEARIVEVSHSSEIDLGVNWNAAHTAATRNPNISLSSNPVTGGVVGQLTIGTLQAGMDLAATLSVLESKGKVNTISNPRIATLNNQTATLKASQNIPYATSNISNGVVSNVITYLELPITLTVTPQVTRDGQVLMNPLTLTVTTVTNTGTPPSTSTRSATTQMMVDDGETIAIGGMVRDESITRESKVPLLGDIPLLGFLFRSNVTTKNKVELVVFLTTHILE